ncbi:glutamine amidotransferase [Longimycelium tulufanense]|uniref:Lipid II isoglutaminyl synthase (glutamine-hydrolyzing) subunit GatD n=1 Tax=Longimycelium tulufanense TaxID=907463 RepID=A0A8J3FVQ4_9PSEU|nr:glutamine amidotransferase [Longimycelium tulufanense]GGM59951.1 glutamine amidotransferase [Longimycelium tulufanense]
MGGTSSVRIALVFPDLLGTYGDRGNVAVLAERLRLRGVDSEVIECNVGDFVPADCDIYMVGGGEDVAQLVAVRHLRRQGTLAAAVERGAVVLAVCAGMQIIGTSFVGTEGVVHGGLGLLDVSTRPMPKRAIGELVVRPTSLFGDELLTGFENHGGCTYLGPDASPLGAVVSGVGNGVNGVDGAVQGRVVGTYLHGPCLARNPRFADKLLTWVTGTELASLSIPEVEALRAERLRAVGVR